MRTLSLPSSGTSPTLVRAEKLTRLARYGADDTGRPAKAKTLGVKFADQSEPERADMMRATMTR